LASTSSDGQKHLQDNCDIVRTVRLMIQEKHADAAFQKFVWQMRDVEGEDGS
jgi:hypothetical protein